MAMMMMMIDGDDKIKCLGN